MSDTQHPFELFRVHAVRHPGEIGGRKMRRQTFRGQRCAVDRIDRDCHGNGSRPPGAELLRLAQDWHNHEGHQPTARDKFRKLLRELREDTAWNETAPHLPDPWAAVRRWGGIKEARE